MNVHPMNQAKLADPHPRNEPYSCSVVIPVYNSEVTLPPLVERLSQVLPGVCPDYEIILVNDGSRDRSWQVISELVQQYPNLRSLNLMRNYGQHNALLCGIRAAEKTIIITMDDDLQHPPEEIPKLLAPLAEGYDVVYGVPAHLPHSWWRNLFSVLTKRLLAYIMGVRNVRDIGAFRAFRSHLRHAFHDYRNPNVIIDVLLSWGTSRFTTATVNQQPRAVGRSNYSFFKLAQYFLTILTGFSTVPLRFASLIGFLFTFLGIGIFFYVLGVYFLVGSIPGFPFLASIISIFSGTQLFALGIMGEYMARIFDRSMDRPPYIVGQKIASHSEHERPQQVEPRPEQKVTQT